MIREVHRGWRRVVAPQHADAAAVSVLIGHDRRDIVRVERARAGDDKRRAPIGVAGGAAVDINLVALRGGWPELTGGVLVARARLAAARAHHDRADLGRIAAVDRVGWIIGVAIEPAIEVASGGDCPAAGDNIQLLIDIIPQAIGPGRRAAVELDAGIVPVLGRDVEPVDMPGFGGGVEHIGPPKAVAVPELALGLIAGWPYHARVLEREI